MNLSESLSHWALLPGHRCASFSFAVFFSYSVFMLRRPHGAREWTLTSYMQSSHLVNWASSLDLMDTIWSKTEGNALAHLQHSPHAANTWACTIILILSSKWECGVIFHSRLFFWGLVWRTFLSFGFSMLSTCLFRGHCCLLDQAGSLGCSFCAPGQGRSLIWGTFLPMTSHPSLGDISVPWSRCWVWGHFLPLSD